MLLSNLWLTFLNSIRVLTIGLILSQSTLILPICAMLPPDDKDEETLESPRSYIQRLMNSSNYRSDIERMMNSFKQYTSLQLKKFSHQNSDNFFIINSQSCLPFSKNEAAPEKGNSFPLYKIETTEGIFYLLGTIHNYSGINIPKNVLSVIENCDYGIQECFTGREPRFPAPLGNFSLLEDSLSEIVKNPSNGIIMGKETVQFFKKIKKDLKTRGFYTNSSIQENPDFKKALDIISNVDNWSEKVL